MTVHIAHPSPDERKEWLVDGCERCCEYVETLGLSFTPDRWRSFWRKMVAVEFDNKGGYDSVNDKRLGSKLHLVALGLQRAFGVDPRLLAAAEPGRGIDPWSERRYEIVYPLAGGGSIVSLMLVANRDPLTVDEQAAADLARLAAVRMVRRQQQEDCPGHEWGEQMNIGDKEDAFCLRCGARRTEVAA